MGRDRNRADTCGSTGKSGERFGGSAFDINMPARAVRAEIKEIKQKRKQGRERPDVTAIKLQSAQHPFPSKICAKFNIGVQLRMLHHSIESVPLSTTVVLPTTTNFMNISKCGVRRRRT
jgi:hypothetical protein